MSDVEQRGEVPERRQRSRRSRRSGDDFATKAQVRGNVRRATVAFILLTLISTFSARLAYKAGDDGKKHAQQATAALCALRDDLQTRVDTGQDFLKAHPRGAFGLSPATISTTLDGQRRTINALSVLRC